MLIGLILIIISIIGVVYGTKYKKNLVKISAIVLLALVIVIGIYFYFNPY